MSADGYTIGTTLEHFQHTPSHATMPTTAEQLQTQFQDAGLRFETTIGGLTKLVLKTPLAAGELYLQGAHVTSFVPVNQQDLLWVSQHSHFAENRPIRGGVPICFPWFGPNANDPSLPGHGYARLKSWQLNSVVNAEDEITLELRTQIGEFELSYEVTFGHVLEMKLITRLSNTASAPASFEAALHTYLAISDIHQVAIEGLETAEYIDKVDGAKRKPAAGKAIRFDGECDRVYLDTQTACRLIDPGWNRTIEVSKQGSQATVVWNPWIAKSAAMADYGNDEWPSMVCIETANAGPHAVTLQPGQSQTMIARIGLR
jgi:glucose-6-phosphate 1-epimerase